MNSQKMINKCPDINLITEIIRKWGTINISIIFISSLVSLITLYLVIDEFLAVWLWGKKDGPKCTLINNVTNSTNSVFFFFFKCWYNRHSILKWYFSRNNITFFQNILRIENVLRKTRDWNKTEVKWLKIYDKL